MYAKQASNESKLLHDHLPSTIGLGLYFSCSLERVGCTRKGRRFPVGLSTRGCVDMNGMV